MSLLEIMLVVEVEVKKKVSLHLMLVAVLAGTCLGVLDEVVGACDIAGSYENVNFLAFSIGALDVREVSAVFPSLGRVGKCVIVNI